MAAVFEGYKNNNNKRKTKIRKNTVYQLEDRPSDKK